MREKTVFSLQKGFTLLELLIVISIIGILVAMGTVYYATAQKKGRDSRRKGDLKSIQNGMEECYALATEYPTVTNAMLLKSSSSSLTCTDSSSTVVITDLPGDPKGGSGSEYTVSDSDSDSYTFCTTLETDGSSFCVSSLQ